MARFCPEENYWEPDLVTVHCWRCGAEFEVDVDYVDDNPWCLQCDRAEQQTDEPPRKPCQPYSPCEPTTNKQTLNPGGAISADGGEQTMETVPLKFRYAKTGFAPKPVVAPVDCELHFCPRVVEIVAPAGYKVLYGTVEGEREPTLFQVVKT